jgi:hypothetical protein
MMKQLSLLILSILLSACAASVVEERDAPPPTLDIQPPMVVEQGTTDEEPAIESPRSLFITTEQVPRVFVQNLATHRRPDFVTFITEEEMKTYQEVFFIYQFRSDLQSMFPTVVLPDVATYHYEVKEVGSQRHIYLNPGDFVRQMDLFGDLKQIDVTEEGIFELPFSFPSLDRSRSIESFGSIAVVTTALNDGEKVGFLPADRHVVFRDSDEALAQDFDTYIFMYEQNNDPNYPRNNFGQVLNPGEILGLKREGKTFILLRFSSHLRPELSQLRSNVLSLKGRVRIEEYLELSRGMMFSPNGFTRVPVRLVDNENIPFSPLDVCRIPTVTRHNNGMRTGFPYERFVTKDQGTVRIAVIPLDFPNFPGDSSFLPILKDDVMRAEEWSRFMTGGKMTYEIEFVEQWVRLPFGPDYYPTYGNAFQNERQPWQQAMQQVFTAADPFIDFRNIDFAYFVFPYESLLYKPTVLYGQIDVTTSRVGRVQMAIYGNENLHVYAENRFFKHMVHETLHFQGFVGHGPCHNCDIGIMVRDNGTTAAILSWEGFLATWYGEDDVYCLSKDKLIEPVQYYLESLDELGGSPGYKNLMIPLSRNEIMIIEYRTDGPFSTLPKEQHGILIYIVNTARSSNYPSPEWVAVRTDPNSYWFTLMTEHDWHIFRPGQSVTYNGVHVEVIESNVVKVSLKS